MFGIVVLEAFDRESGNQADVETLYEHLHFTGAMVVTLAEGQEPKLPVVNPDPDMGSAYGLTERTTPR